MPIKPGKMWFSAASDSTLELERCIDRACSNGDKPVFVFFRADDIAVPGQKFAKMMGLFVRYRVPLSLAVVPAWLTPARWQVLYRYGSSAAELWCWHQHGWRHKNHEQKGKKQEFGSARPPDKIRGDIIRGRNRLEAIVDKAFLPVFTPPWNRCNDSTLQALVALDYLAISRSRGAQPHAPRELPEFTVNVDLHNRKYRRPTAAWKALIEAFYQGIASGYCGVMLHHQWMNDRAFGFLEKMLEMLSTHKQIELVNFRDLLTDTFNIRSR